MDETVPCPVVVTCEHASFAVPADCPSLGVSDEVLRDHVSWDPGAKALAESVARRLDAPAVMGHCSRLVVDLNRSPDNPAVIPASSFGVPVPGNQALPECARTDRLAKFHAPYWSEVARRIDRAVSRHGYVIHVSVHSFTPRMDPEGRRFDVGLLFHPERRQEVRIALQAKEHLMSAGWSTELNRPYSGDMDGIATPHRGRMSDDTYACLEVEANQGRMTEGWERPLAGAIAEVVKKVMRDRARRD